MTRLHIFRAGTHTAVSGHEVSFSEADVAGIAASYDTAVHEAPIVVGHPKLDSPAYGWVERVTAAGQDLEARPHQVAEAFAEAVAEGRYKKISAAFYMPGSPGHPLGAHAEAPYLKHVGFLGGAAPAVKGLQPIEFAGDEEGVEVVELAEIDVAAFGWADRRVLSFMRRLRDFIVDKFDAEAADRVISSNELDWAIEEDVRMEERAVTDQSPGFSESNGGRLGEASLPNTIQTETMADDRTAEFAERETQLTAREREIQEREEALAAQERERQHAANVAFAEGLADDGARILPRHVPVVAAVLDALGGGDAPETVSFAEAEEELPLADAFRQLLEELPEQVSFGEHSRPQLEEDSSTVAEFAAPPGVEVDQAGLALHRKALAYQREHEGVTYVAAVRAVSP